MRKWILMCCLGVYCVLLSAQPSYRTGLLPAVNINKSLGDKWRLNIKQESRVGAAQGYLDTPYPWKIDYKLTDISALIVRRAGPNSRWAAGYLLRIQEGLPTHRLIQQYTTVSSLYGFRLGHRFSADQTFSEQEDTELRLRYRLASDLALQGQSVDPREFYLKFSNEYLHALQGGKYDLEIRLVSSLGFAITDDNKLEGGLDYRLDRFLGEAARHTLWWALSWYVNL